MRSGQSFFAAALAISLLGCAVQQPTPASEVGGETVIENSTAALRQQFDRATTDDGRGRAAALLLAKGDHDARYWSFLSHSADRALQDETRAAEAWRRSLTIEERHERAKVPSTQRIADGNLTLPASDASSDKRTSSLSRAYISGRTTVYDLSERSLDSANVAPLLYLSVSGDPRGRPYLYRAVQSDNVLLAAQGALGLAKLKDQAAIEMIFNSARRFRGQKLLFAQALVYFNEPAANRYAEQLVPSPALLQELQSIARTNGYDPYPAVSQ